MFNKSEIENMMAKCVDEIWEKHDTDGNGVKSNEEIKHILRKLVLDTSEGGELNEVEFEQSFRKIKRNSHGAIDKIDMVQWLKTMVQGQPPLSVSESDRNSIKSGFRTDIKFRSSQMQKTGLDPADMIRRIERAEKVAFLSPLKYKHNS